jgi:hypothetical protein
MAGLSSEKFDVFERAGEDRRRTESNNLPFVPGESLRTKTHGGRQSRSLSLSSCEFFQMALTAKRFQIDIRNTTHSRVIEC